MFKFIEAENKKYFGEKLMNNTELLIVCIKELLTRKVNNKKLKELIRKEIK